MRRALTLAQRTEWENYVLANRRAQQSYDRHIARLQGEFELIQRRAANRRRAAIRRAALELMSDPPGKVNP